MALVAGKILFVYKEIMVCVKLPKTAIKHVKVFVREILAHYIYIVFIADLKKRVH